MLYANRALKFTQLTREELIAEMALDKPHAGSIQRVVNALGITDMKITRFDDPHKQVTTWDEVLKHAQRLQDATAVEPISKEKIFRGAIWFNKKTDAVLMNLIMEHTTPAAAPWLTNLPHFQATPEALCTILLEYAQAKGFLTEVPKNSVSGEARVSALARYLLPLKTHYTTQEQDGQKKQVAQEILDNKRAVLNCKAVLKTLSAQSASTDTAIMVKLVYQNEGEHNVKNKPVLHTETLYTRIPAPLRKKLDALLDRPLRTEMTLSFKNGDEALRVATAIEHYATTLPPALQNTLTTSTGAAHGR